MRPLALSDLKARIRIPTPTLPHGVITAFLPTTRVVFFKRFTVRLESLNFRLRLDSSPRPTLLRVKFPQPVLPTVVTDGNRPNDIDGNTLSNVCAQLNRKRG